MKSKKDTSNRYEELHKYLEDNGLTVDQAIAQLDGIKFDPAKDFYATLITASRDIIQKVQSKSLNFDTSGFDKSLFLLLQAGDKINKSLKLAKLEAYPDDDELDDGETGVLDRIRK